MEKRFNFAFDRSLKKVYIKTGSQKKFDHEEKP